MKLELNQIVSERYKILERIGIGGMANVYCAKDIKLDRKVTFKVLKEEFIYEEFIEKFRKEAMAAAKLSHTNIANVYDVGNDGNIYYIVMEYVDGYTLKDITNVYCANDIKLDRKVTFKVLKEEFVDEEFIKKFNKEATAAAKISHLNIANVYDVGNDGNIHYIVMEYIDGYTLKDIIKIKAPFSNEEVLGIGIQIANALSVAHNSGIIHRDIKPENILITKDGVAKVTDFGIARGTGSNTITTEAMGSVHYFSPEQAKGEYTDSKTDIYSLGIVMYEMITGKLPFEGEGVVQLAMKHINEPLPNMRNINNNISESLERIILKATDKSIINRYRTAEDLIEDLKKALYDESGNFVLEEDFADSPTVVISQEQIDMINNLSSKNKYYDEEEYEDEDEDEEEYQSKKNSKKYSKKSINESLQEQRERALDKKITIFAILTGLAIATVISSFLIFWFVSGEKAEVPNFEGKTYEEAVNIAMEREIYIRNTAEEYSDTIEKGAIISQKIKAGDKIAKGETVDIVLSLGTDKIELKDFTGMDISEVYSIIEEEEINLNLVEEYISDEKIARGKVVNQIPKGGSSIRLDEKVTLYISKGKEDSFVIVPRLKNLTVEEAKSTLKSLGLNLGNVEERESNAEKGKIISQSIAQGNQAEEGDTIDVTISLGKATETTTENKKETTTEKSSENIIQNSTEETTEITTENNKETTTEITTNLAPVLKDAVLTIAPTLPEGSSNFEVKIIKKTSTEQSEIYVRSHSPKDFPLKINVSGNEPTEFQVYIDGKLLYSEKKFN